MTKTTFPALMVLSTIALLSSAQGQAMTDYTWDNAKGFQPSGNCSVIAADKIPFKISKSKSQMIAKDGTVIILAPKTLVTTADDDGKGTSSIFVVSSPITSSKTADRDDEGTVKTSVLEDLGDSVLALGADTPLREIGDLKIKIAGTFVQAAIKNEQYQILNCVVQSKPRQFVLFDVFTADESAPVARIGVSSDDTRILRAANAMTPEDAEKSISQQRLSTSPTAPSIARMQGASAAQAGRTPAKPDPKAIAKTEPSFIETAMSTLSTTLQQTGITSAPKPASKPVSVNAQAASQEKANQNTQANVPVIQGSLDYVVCSKQATVQVKDTDLRKNLFKAKKLEKIVPVQSFGVDRQEFEGQTYQKVQFSGRNSEIGWLPLSSVAAESSCFNIDEATDARIRASANTVSAGSLASDQFPMIHRTVKSYKVAPLRFRSMRGGGRLHAACDLYRPNGENVVAIGDGVVVRGKYYFYQGVYAIEVRHNGGFIARYGEVLGRSAAGVGTGSRVKAGQTVGYVGTVNSGCCSPMMHFEMYRGTAIGPLTVRHGGFERRSDLMDPTNYLSTWEKAKFGASY